MARTNKYSSVNFNHIYDKNLTSPAANSTANSPSRTSSASYATISSTRAHGRMLVLTRPTPNPAPNLVSPPPASPVPQSPLQAEKTPARVPGQTRNQPESDLISLRPLGSTGAGSLGSPTVVGEKEKEVGAVSVGSPKSNKFVPPHLRPGFAGREERPGSEIFRGKEGQQRQPPSPQQQGYFGSPGQYGEDGRPKSGGQGRIRRGVGESDLGLMNRPGSSGNRPNSSG